VVAEERHRRPEQRHVRRVDLVELDLGVIGRDRLQLAAMADGHGDNADQDDGSDSEQHHGHR
jgi:hypothetical protein